MCACSLGIKFRIINCWIASPNAPRYILQLTVATLLLPLRPSRIAIPEPVQSCGNFATDLSAYVRYEYGISWQVCPTRCSPIYRRTPSGTSVLCAILKHCLEKIPSHFVFPFLSIFCTALRFIFSILYPTVILLFVAVDYASLYYPSSMFILIAYLNLVKKRPVNC